MARQVVNAFSWSDETTLPQDLSNLKQLIEEKVYSSYGRKHSRHECMKWRRILTILSDYYQDPSLQGSSLPSSVKSWAAKDKKNLGYDIAVDGDCKVWKAVLEPTKQQTVEMKQEIDEWLEETFFGEKPAQYGYLVVRQIKTDATDKEKQFADFSEELAAFVKDKLGTIGIPMRARYAKDHIKSKDQYTITNISGNNPNHPLGSNLLEDIITYRISRKVKTNPLEHYFNG